MRSVLIKYKSYFISLAFFIAYAISYSIIFYQNNQETTQRLTTKLNEIETKLDRIAELKLKEIVRYGTHKSWLEQNTDGRYAIHIYKNDSLLYWNTNQLPVSRFADIHFPSEGINHLQNGWYLTKTKSANGYIVAASFLIKTEYPYQNEHLINGFSKELKIPIAAHMVIDKESPLRIVDSKKNYLFSIEPFEEQIPQDSQSFILLFLLIAAIGFLVIALFSSFKQSKLKYAWIFPLILVLLRIISLGFSKSFFTNDVAIFSESLFYMNPLFPNFYEYLINVFVITFLTSCLVYYIKQIKGNTFFTVSGLFILLIGSFAFWFFILFVTDSLVINSTIHLLTDQFFKLNLLSYLALFSIGILFFNYYSILAYSVDAFERIGYKRSHLGRFLFLIGVLFVISSLVFTKYHLVGIFIPLIVSLWLVFTLRKKPVFITTEINGLFLLMVAAIFIAVNLTWSNEVKMKQDREILAQQLASEKQVETEKEYVEIARKISSEPFLNRISKSTDGMDLRDFEYSMERKIFTGYWEKYDMNFNLFDSNGRSVITKDNLQFKDLSLLIRDHCERSKIDSNIFYVTDYTSQLSYVILQPFFNADSNKFYLSATLKSKKIPEGIGFPRLLISSKASVLESLEKFSIAKYHNRKLVSKYGEFGYPSSPFLLPEKAKKGYITFGGYTHYVFKQTKNDAIIISCKIYTFLDVLTSFSYVFTFFGLVLLPFYLSRNGKFFFKNTISLALKIQLLLVGIVFFSLFAFGWGSGIFVRNQYNKFTNNIINEKLVSLETELRNKIGEMNYLDVDENGNYVSYLLTKLSKVFVTDINLYDPNGHILATSRPKVFNIGLIGEQMNTQAFNQLKIQNKSEYIHQENIGELNYISAYLPFFNSDGKLLAFVNLQHFGQQQEVENQIQQFLVAIINVFMLLLAISIILAIIMSNWVTKPLRLLQTNLSLIRFGKKNQMIDYDKNDEIGVLVKEYNNKLKELEQTADQLAKSERESAWRDMAKQVAHEIKNPLTPMKLSIQQMMRVFEKENPEAKVKIERLANSLIEQIDGLTKIANEFSSFAKMPSPVLEKIELIEICKNVIAVFSQEEFLIKFSSNQKRVIVSADKDQLIRAINNLLKNSIQSFVPHRKGEINVLVEVTLNTCSIQIKDNGSGISLHEQNKIFTPYFTTKSTGTGIGLSITKQIIENHNGTIRFESTEDAGTVFTIELPLTNDSIA